MMVIETGCAVSNLTVAPPVTFDTPQPVGSVS